MRGSFALRDDGPFRAARCLERTASGYSLVLCRRSSHFRAGNRTEIGNVLACLGRC